jgi:acyl-CoA thioesterase FadM
MLLAKQMPSVYNKFCLQAYSDLCDASGFLSHHLILDVFEHARSRYMRNVGALFPYMLSSCVAVLGGQVRSKSFKKRKT